MVQRDDWGWICGGPADRIRHVRSVVCCVGKALKNLRWFMFLKDHSGYCIEDGV